VSPIDGTTLRSVPAPASGAAADFREGEQWGWKPIARQLIGS